MTRHAGRAAILAREARPLRIGVRLCLIGMSYGCSRPGPVVLPDATETDTVDSLADTDMIMPDLRRPLCRVEATRPPVAADLATWAAALSADRNFIFGRAALDALEALGPGAVGADVEETVTNLLQRAWARLAFANVDGAIEDAQAALDLSLTDVPAWRGRARQVLAVTWIRRAELDNCVTNETGEACLHPFSEAGLQQRREGMTHASEALSAFLDEDDSTVLTAKWLLNVANMALGTWPDGVDARWRVPPEAFQSAEPMTAWTNVGPATPLRVPDLAGGAVIEDFDGDGLLDLLVSSFEPEAGMQLLLQQGEGHYCDASDAAGLSAITGILSMVQGDFDNDGDVDVFAPRGAWMQGDGLVRPSLLRNDGTGRFTDVAVSSGVASVLGPTQVAAWGDVDGDGWLDLFVGREVVDSVRRIYAPSSLYLNQRDGTFVDAASESGVHDMGFVKGASFGDVDNDGDLDLFVGVMGRPNVLYVNRGDGIFSDAPEGPWTLADEPSFGTGLFDYDQDGRLDLLVNTFAGSFGGATLLGEFYGRAADAVASHLFGVHTDANHVHLFRNTVDGFVDVSAGSPFESLHLVMGWNHVDLDADGWPDLYLGTGAPAFEALMPNIALRNHDGERFVDVTTAVHLGHLQKGHAIAAGDLDEDGDEDLLASIGGAYRGDRFPDALFVNPSTGMHAVSLRLIGVATNRSAMGTRVRIFTPTRVLHHLVGTGGSFGSNSLQVEAALGQESAIDHVEIDWLGGATEFVRDIEVDSVVTLRQGHGVVDSRPFARIPLAEIGAAHQE